MIFSVIAKTERFLPGILAEAGVDFNTCEISDYKNIGAGEKSLILIGDGRKLKPILNKLVLLNGRSNFDWCYVI